MLPDDLLWVEDPATKEKIRVVPGDLRDRDVAVGRHVPVSAGALPRFLERFEEVYGKLGKTDTIIATAAAHHRLLWIHPFLDGNGRVARLMSHATLLDSLDTAGVWSIARGLARSVDLQIPPRRLRPHPPQRSRRQRTLKRRNLAAFTSFFLTTCIDQVTFMEGLMQPDRLRARILLWAEEEIRLDQLPPKSGAVLEALLYRGELPRGDAAAI